MSHALSGRELRVLLRDLGMIESPRWHEGKLWFSNRGTDEIVTVDLDGHSNVHGRGGGGTPAGQPTGSRTDACSSQALS